MVHTDLSKFDPEDYKAGNRMKVLIWFIINYYIFNCSFPWPMKLKAFLLRAFGASVGKGLIIKINVRIKNPWRLIIGENCWIGESVWIDNLENVVIGNNVCISQGAMLLTGNHDYTKSTFPYKLAGINIEDGVWIGAQSVVCPGVKCESHAILTVNSVATKDLQKFSIYSGNPAVLIRDRKMNG